MHWSVQVQVPDFFPSLDGIYWITLRTYISVHCTYYRSKTATTPIAAIIVPPFITSYYSRTYYVTYDFLPHLLHFAFLHHEKRK